MTIKTFFKISLCATLALTASCSNDEPGDSSNERKDITLTRSEKAIVDCQNGFALDLFKSRFIDNDNINYHNVVISPIATSIEMGLIANATSGDALEEILSVLSPEDPSLTGFNELNRNLIGSMQDIDKATTVNFSNSVWIDDEFEIKNKYVEAANYFFNASCKAIDTHSDSDLRQINQWASNVSNGLIQSIPFTRGAPVVILNISYFKGNWTYPFEKSLIDEMNFSNVDGSKSKVEGMNKTLTKTKGEEILFIHSPEYIAGALPYGNKAYSYYAILPPENSDFYAFVRSFDMKKWHEIKDNMELRNDIIISVPKYDVSYLCFDFQNQIRNSGIKKVFTQDNSLSNLADGLSMNRMDMGHQVRFKVDAIGTEVAASVETMTLTHHFNDDPNFIPTNKLILNRPFIYLIEEQSTGAILFIGEIDKL